MIAIADSSNRNHESQSLPVRELIQITEEGVEELKVADSKLEFTESHSEEPIKDNHSNPQSKM